MEKVRIQKIIADSGYCSRRRAEQYIQNGDVKVNGRPCSIGDKADPRNDLITVNGEETDYLTDSEGNVTLNLEEEGIYIIFV